MTNEPAEQQETADYERLGRCVFCGEAAAYRVWWDDYDAAWLVCPVHFTVITSQPHQFSQQALDLEESVRALQDIGRCTICKGDGSPQCVTCHDYQTCQCTPGYGKYADKCWACKGTGYGDSRARDVLEKLGRLQ